MDGKNWKLVQPPSTIPTVQIRAATLREAVT